MYLLNSVEIFLSFFGMTHGKSLHFCKLNNSLSITPKLL